MKLDLVHLDLAQWLGLTAMTIWVFSLSLKSDRRLNQVWILCNILWVTHYFMLGAYVGAVNVFINLLRSVLYLAHDWRRSQYKHHVFGGLMALFTISSIVTFHELSDLLPLFASYGTCVSFFLLQGFRARSMLLFANSGWLFYAAAHGSYGGVIGASAGLIITLFTLVRLWRDEKAVAALTELGRS